MRRKKFLLILSKCLLKNVLGFHGLKNIFLLTTCFTLFSVYSVQATHISGADMSYKWISGNTFELTLTLYRDCSGIAAPNSVSVNYKSTTCGYNLNVTLSRVPGTGEEITQPCDSSATNCTTGSMPGIQKFEYTAPVTLPANCSDWIFGYSICCRNCAITTLTYTPNNCSGVPATYIEATLNNLSATNNSSPVFTNVPVSFFCIGKEIHYNHGAYDADGDSLVYSFVTPRSSASNNVVFKNGYSSTGPIASSPPITLNANGDIVMTPTAIEVGVMAMLVKEYRNGILIGTVLRDMQMWVTSCTNDLPEASGINGTGNFSINACPDVPLTFTINSGDLNSSQIVSMNWNHGIPLGNFSSTASSRPVGTFSWTPTQAHIRTLPYTFTVTVQDNNCPSNGFQTFSYSIYVKPMTASVSVTNSLCASPGTGSATVSPSGNAPFSYAWSPGGQTTSSINNLLPGNYSVIVTDANGCMANSTANISSPPSLNPSVLSLGHATCNGTGSGFINIQTTGGVAPYSYNWSPWAGTSAMVRGLYAGIYTCVVTDENNCSKTINVSITEPPVLNAIASGSTLKCFGASNGFASVTASGGTLPYKYLWSNGATASVVNGLSAGSYSVLVTDARGCSVSAIATVTEPPLLTGSASNVTPVSCRGGNDGAGAVVAAGGTSPYNYLWNPSGLNTQSASGLPASNYAVTVTDANNCSTTVPVHITEPAKLIASIDQYSGLTCFGDSSGQATVNASGGIFPYSYLWTPSGSTASTISGLSAGNYSVIVTDANNCSLASSVTIRQPAIFSLNVVSVSNSSCYGYSNGSAEVACLGGTPPYSYLWSVNGANTNTIGNLSAGLYNVTATDANGCTASVSVIISQPSELTSNVSVSNTRCFNDADGNATVTPAGGVGPYAYIWSHDGSTSSMANNLTAGVYEVVITDSKGCSFTDSAVVEQPDEIIVSITSVNSTCGMSNGMLSAVISGGTPSYNYSWSNGNTNDTLFNLSAGMYTISVIDANGCSVIKRAGVSNNGAPVVSLASVTPVTCNGGNNGAASISVSGGFEPYSYQWIPAGGTGQTATGLTADSYSVMVTNSLNCSSVLIIDIHEPPVIKINSLVTPVSCFGGVDGSITLKPKGGTGNYNFSWSTGFVNNPVLSGIASGNYSVTVSDQSGCSMNSQIAVGEPAPLNVVAAGFPVTCYGYSNGSVSVDATGGNSPYTYSWDNMNGNLSSHSSLAAGSYPVTVTDNKGCTSTGIAVVDQPQNITVQATTTDGTCSSSNGIIELTVTGGLAPYSYLWDQRSDTTSIVSGLPAGNYSIVVSDSNGCQATINKHVSNSGLPSLWLSSIKNVSCYGGNDGEAMVSVSNAKSPFTFSWQPGGSTREFADSLSAGTYNVWMTDDNGCTRSLPVVITEPNLLSASVISSNVTCYDADNGMAAVNPSGGAGAYTYSWVPGGMNSSVSDTLSGGTYTVTVTDENNCSTQKIISIDEPLPMILSSATSLAGCNLSNGSASVNVTGGIQPYRYTWNVAGLSGPILTDVSAGSYIATVTDSNNCTDSVFVSVSNTTGPMVALVNVTDVKCPGGSDGSAEVQITSGVPPFAISWSPAGGNALKADNLLAGSYSVSIRDSNNCITSLSVVVNQPNAIEALITPEQPGCNGGSDGSAIAMISGGTAPYTFSWSSGDSTSATFNLSKGIYSLTVTDAENCNAIFNTFIDEPSALSLNVITTNVSCHGRKDGFGQVTPSGGTPPYSYLWSTGSTFSAVNDFFAGSYTVRVTDAHGCFVDTSIVITEPDKLIINVDWTDVTCRDLEDGSASAIVTGGTAPYTYTWQPAPGNGPSISNLAPGDYDLIVMDINGCKQKKNFHIGMPQPITLVATPYHTKCFGSNSGMASIAVYGGKPPYSYLWSTGDTNSTATNLVAGNYSIVVTDSSGCSSFAAVTIEQPAMLMPVVTNPQLVCVGQSVRLLASCTGGTPPYQYTWNNGSNGTEINVIVNASVSYHVTVSDANGCTSGPALANVSVYPSLQVNSGGPDTICEGTAANLTVTGSGGNGGPYMFTWSNGQIGSHITPSPLTSTTFTVSAYDNCGSTPVSVSIPVIVLPKPIVNFLPDPIEGCKPLLVNFRDYSTPNGIEYYWSFGDGNADTSSNPSHVYLDEGSYTVNVHVTSPDGCKGSTTISNAVNVFPVPVAGFTNIPEETSVYNPMISFFDESTNSSAWEWDFGDNSPHSRIQNTEHLYQDTGTYVVKLIATSNKGCIDTAFGKVTIKGEFAFYIPNTFTPNNDAVNDFFTPLGIGVKEFQMLIFDRWGLTIFTSDDFAKGWNGKINNNGTPCQADVYVYKIEIVDLQGKNHSYVGRVNLVR